MRVFISFIIIDAELGG